MSLRRLAAAALAGNALANPLRSRQDSTVFTSDGNPILSDGSVYSADPAPFVVNETVYVLTGHDEAPPGVNDFIMNEWQIFEAVAPKPEGGEWTLHRGVASPQNVFAWANPGGAYASQIVPGPDGRYYLYASVTQRGATTQDAFGVGVAASSSPTGPFVDIHPSGPIISQSVPEPNNIHNIDPVVLIDDDGRVFVYWGSFNQLRGVELDASDMVTPKGSIVSVNSLTGFFEAPWLMRRADTYYMLYAANNAGPDSPCTPTSYHACIAYGTSPGPLGPWTFRGVVLPIVSSTTSHPGVYELGGQHHLVYHTADAVEGGHFRRSVALDLLEFDDTSSPPSIRQVKQTFRAALTAPRPPSRNVAPLASGVTSLNPTPIQYWIAALNDERILQSPLPPDYWSSWAGDRSPQRNVLTYTWDQAVRLNGVAMSFFADSPAGSNVGVAPPAEWYVEFLNASGAWERLAATSAGGYVTAVSNTPAEVSFREVETTSLRATLVASGSGSTFAAVGVKEWFVFSPEPVAF
ncbi:glycosyl hydrolase family 43 protein [Plectosphaerella plurivora]|uniref:Glycosyl hydrolase family 43 protein n=1 Tax=Plectosphaerella plurivora TaxID=936078 RepID=A0A9P8V8F1_9PEZI|nr:glycosyl hydrolase family 43 protein [Plectosphaerella plurivora]